MNIWKESLEEQINFYTDKLEKYYLDPEYTDPNCSLQQAEEELKKLLQEYHTNYKIY